MENSLGITAANLAKNSDYMFLHDPAVYLDLHGGSGLLPFGFMEKEKVFKATSEYAVFKTGVPETEVRRDIVSQEFVFEGKTKQVQPDIVALIAQRLKDDSDSSFTRVVMGTDVPEPLFPSLVLVGKNVNKKEMRLYIRKLQLNSEDFEMALGGNEYSSIPFKGYAQQDLDPIRTNPDWLYIGKVTETLDYLTGAEVLTGLTTTSGLLVGGAVVGEGIPDGTVITSIANLASGEVGISNAVTDDVTDGIVYLENDVATKDQDNIAFFAWAK